MGRALELARLGLGQVWPNPTVGCVLVKNNEIIAEGRTADGGRPHGEREALDGAGLAAKGSTAYVSLEPCAHTGETPPCASALIKAGVVRVIYAIDDPDPRVAGKGRDLLIDAGLDVGSGLMAKEAREVNQGFFTRITKNRPFVILKMATSLDGKIASDTSSTSGQIEWITGKESRAEGHVIRSQSDAILVGINTVLADDPLLNCRIEGKEDRSPVRIVLDSQLKTPLTSKLVLSANELPVWIVTQSRDTKKTKFLTGLGCKVIVLENTKNLEVVLSQLAGEGITRLMVEGGAKIHASFLQAGFVDEIKWFRAQKNIGPDGLDAINNVNFDKIKDALGLISKNIQVLGKDTLETFVTKV